MKEVKSPRPQRLEAQTAGRLGGRIWYTETRIETCTDGQPKMRRAVLLEAGEKR